MLEHLAGRAGDLLEEVQRVAEVERLVIAVVARVGLFQQKWPYLHSPALFNLCEVDVIGTENSIIVLNDRYVIVNDCEFPNVFLEDLDQVYAEVVALVAIKHLAEDAPAVFDAVEGLTNEVVAVVLAG